MGNLPIDMGTSDGSPHSTPADHLAHHVALHRQFNATVQGPFALTAANTNTGVTLYTPEVGDRIIGISVEFTQAWVTDDVDDGIGIGIAGTTAEDLAFQFPLLHMLPPVKPTFPRGQGVGIPFGGEVVRILTEDPLVARNVSGLSNSAGALNLWIYSISTAAF